MPATSHNCPKCKYDLRGHFASWTDTCPLRTLCPECGFEFYTGDLLADYLPETHVVLRQIDGCLATIIVAVFGAVLMVGIIWILWILGALFVPIP